jgi:hypothetical protein
VVYLSLETLRPALYWATYKVGGQESRSVTTGKPISSQLKHGKLIRATLIRLDILDLYAKLSSRLDKVVWGVFWKVFKRSFGPPTRSVGLLVGRTHLSGTAVSLVDGEPGVPMSHTCLMHHQVSYKLAKNEYHPGSRCCNGRVHDGWGTWRW